MGPSVGRTLSSGRSRKQRMMDQVLQGRPVTAFEIIDGHAHLGRFHNFYIPANTAADMVRQMDRAGIRCCISSGHAAIGPAPRIGNDMVIEAMREFPGRIYGYCCVNPNYPAQELRDELERCFDAGMIGVKLHPCGHRYCVDGEGYRPAWEFAQERRACLLCHTAVTEPWDPPSIFDKLAAQYPNVKIIMGHSGFGYEGGRQCCELAKKHANVYLDITGSIAYTDLLEQMVDGAGAGRLLFGTDVPFIDCRPQVGRVAFSRLDDSELELVLGGNARRLFGLG